MPIVTVSSRNVADKAVLLVMRMLFLSIVSVWLVSTAMAANHIYHPNVKSLQAVVNQDWLSPTVMRLKSDDRLYIAFDELSHDNHRFICQVEHCETDWSVSEELFVTDWLDGFSSFTIDDYERSINTTVPYTHYRFTIPNEQCHLILSGNYRLHIIDEDVQEEIASVEFMVTEQSMPLTMSASTNTDIDNNGSHQQVAFSASFGDHLVTDIEGQIQTVVMQNGREETWRKNIRPSMIRDHGLRWEHRKDLIFDGGNEYRKFEVLSTSHPTMGIERISWDGETFQAYPFVSEPRPVYLYDEDANGAFYIRNSDNRENDVISDYVWVNFRLKSERISKGNIIIDGHWTTEDPQSYEMTYDEESKLYTARILLKQGYYSYQYLWVTPDGQSHPLPSEGNYFETENRYQALIYYKGIGERTWRLTGYEQITLQ